MLYETLDDIPRDCEVPYERVNEDELTQGSSLEPIDTSSYLPQTNIKDLLDWD